MQSAPLAEAHRPHGLVAVGCARAASLPHSQRSPPHLLHERTAPDHAPCRQIPHPQPQHDRQRQLAATPSFPPDPRGIDPRPPRFLPVLRHPILAAFLEHHQTLRRQRIRASLSPQPPQPRHRVAVPAPCRSPVAAPPVIRRVFDDRGPHRVEVDVGGHHPRRVPQTRPPFGRPLHHHAPVAVLPQGPHPLALPVQPLGEALLQRLHELTQITHAVGIAVDDLPATCRAPAGRQLGPHLRHAPRPMDERKPPQQFLRGQACRVEHRHLHQDVEMVAHHHPGHQPQAPEGCVGLHQHHEASFLHLPEQHLLVHHPRHHVVQPVAPFPDQQSRASHPRPCPHPPPPASTIFQGTDNLCGRQLGGRCKQNLQRDGQLA